MAKAIMRWLDMGAHELQDRIASSGRTEPKTFLVVSLAREYAFDNDDTMAFSQGLEHKLRKGNDSMLSFQGNVDHFLSKCETFFLLRICFTRVCDILSRSAKLAMLDLLSSELIGSITFTGPAAPYWHSR
eukprot:5139159-Amphidinium_carterae.1